MYQDVEFVCSGNEGRSPLAEAVAKKYLDQRKLIPFVNLSSSGTLVGALEKSSDDQIVKVIEPYIPEAVENGYMTSVEAKEIMAGVRVKGILLDVKKRVEKDNKRKLRIILEERGLSRYFGLDRTPTRTVVRQESALIFPVDQENRERVIGIYNGSNLDHFVMIVPLDEIKDSFFATLKEQRRMADKIERETIEKLEKYLYK